MSNHLLQENTVAQIKNKQPVRAESQRNLVNLLLEKKPVISSSLIDPSFRNLSDKSRQNLSNGKYMDVRKVSIDYVDFLSLSHTVPHDGYAVPSGEGKLLVPFTSLVEAIDIFSFSMSFYKQANILAHLSNNSLSIGIAKNDDSIKTYKLGVKNAYSSAGTSFFGQVPEFYKYLKRTDDGSIVPNDSFVNPTQIAAYWVSGAIRRELDSSFSPFKKTIFPIPSEQLTDTYWFMCNNLIINDSGTIRKPTIPEKCKVIKQIIETNPENAFWKLGDKRIDQYESIKHFYDLLQSTD